MEESSVLPERARAWIAQRRRLVVVIAACLVAAVGAAAVYGLVTERDTGVLVADAAEHDVTFERVMGPRAEDARRIEAALEEAEARPSIVGSDVASVYGYDRLSFEWDGQELLDRLKAEHPGTYGGGALDPVDPVLHIAYAGDAGELREAVADASFEAEFVESPTTFAERAEAAARLEDRGYRSDVGEFAERVVLPIAEDELRTDTDRIARMVAYIVDAPGEQVGEIREALFDAPRSGVVVGPLVVVPRAPAA